MVDNIVTKNYITKEDIEDTVQIIINQFKLANQVNGTYIRYNQRNISGYFNSHKTTSGIEMEKVLWWKKRSVQNALKKHHNIVLRGDRLYTREYDKQVQDEKKAKAKWRKENQHIIRHRRNLTKDFQNFFRKRGIRLSVAKLKNGDKSKMITDILEELEVVDFIQQDALLSELQK